MYVYNFINIDNFLIVLDVLKNVFFRFTKVFYQMLMQLLMQSEKPTHVQDLSTILHGERGMVIARIVMFMRLNVKLMINS